MQSRLYSAVVAQLPVTETAAVLDDVLVSHELRMLRRCRLKLRQVQAFARVKDVDARAIGDEIKMNVRDVRNTGAVLVVLTETEVHA